MTAKKPTQPKGAENTPEEIQSLFKPKKRGNKNSSWVTIE